MRCSPARLTGLLLLITAILPRGVQAQAPLGTDILLMATPSRGENPRGLRATNVTNRPGYDNQPCFLEDGRELLYVSMREGQTDVYRLDTTTRTQRRVTSTEESEYSPTPIPGSDGFSVVRVEADGTQRLWRFDGDGAHPRLVLRDVQPVGYHAWLDSNHVALFVLGADDAPSTLQLVDLETGRIDTIATDVGRSLHRIPGTTDLSFVRKETRDRWTIQRYELKSDAVARITETLPGREDFAWTPEGALLMGDGGALYDWRPARGNWERVADFSAVGVTNITRIAVSADGSRMALVVDRPPE